MPTSAVEDQLISSARARAAELVAAFSAATGPSEPSAVSCDRASKALDDYCTALLDTLITAVPPVTPTETQWVRSRYLTLIVEFGSAVRDSLKDSLTRHAAAQVIQFKVLEHERHLRIVLESIAAASAPGVEVRATRSVATNS